MRGRLALVAVTSSFVLVGVLVGSGPIDASPVSSNQTAPSVTARAISTKTRVTYHFDLTRLTAIGKLRVKLRIQGAGNCVFRSEPPMYLTTAADRVPYSAAKLTVYAGKRKLTVLMRMMSCAVWWSSFGGMYVTVSAKVVQSSSPGYRKGDTLFIGFGRPDFFDDINGSGAQMVVNGQMFVQPVRVELRPREYHISMRRI